eukprot:CAMPEP_0197875822 /NCGR_PEP_ID=MMETSP1439-20131203/4977_1 /TAXON_ID=66791 /ORGANISM="Gonyaulax spinifera, Strain CCMP409" /LENGTH=240 /DNA_ID=CAMNT_0043495059 /DNA_START=82 /DNA_END=804 /DNA_ORIENTATION=-
MANFASLDALKKQEEDNKKATTSYAGGDKSGLAIQNPEDEERWRAMQQAASGSSGPLPDGHVVVTVYRNGFVVNDGPFRPITDPLNKKFMDDMAAGRCPPELQAGKKEDVHVALQDKRGEDYKEPPAPAYTKFSGEGNTLNAGASSASAAPVSTSAGSIEVDPSKPKTRIQIRFHNGEKKAQEFNETHTVGDLRQFVQQCVGGQAMTIMGGFPPKPVTDDSLTLKDAGLAGAAVTVKPSS